MTSTQNCPLFEVILLLAMAHKATCMSYGVVDNYEDAEDDEDEGNDDECSFCDCYDYCDADKVG